MQTLSPEELIAHFAQMGINARIVGHFEHRQPACDFTAALKRLNSEQIGQVVHYLHKIADIVDGPDRTALEQIARINEGVRVFHQDAKVGLAMIASVLSPYDGVSEGSAHSHRVCKTWVQSALQDGLAMDIVDLSMRLSGLCQIEFVKKAVGDATARLQALASLAVSRH